MTEEDEHPAWPLQDWRYEVYNRDTFLGYIEWVKQQQESNAGTADG